MFLGRALRGLAALVAVAVVVSAAAPAYPNPVACTGACSWSHDPSVVKRADGKYFLFNTGSKIGISTASSLTGPWTFQGPALPAGSSINLAGNKDLWAPSVHVVGGTYYLFYAVSEFGSRNSAIGYATSTTMEPGSWTDHGETGIRSSSAKPYNAIDAALVQAPDGSYYVTFGSFWADIYQVKMSNPPASVAGDPYQVAYNATGNHALEGASVHHRGAYYYLFFSSGICCGYDKKKPASGAEYSIRVCRSGAVGGPFVDAAGKSCAAGGGGVVLESHGTIYGPGGQGVLSDAAYGGDVLYYHYADTRAASLADSQYRFGFNRISWSTGWPVLV